MKSLKNTAVLFALVCIPAMAQITYPGCANLASGDFKMTELFNKNGGKNADGTTIPSDPTLSEPTRMDVQVVNDPNTGDYMYTNVYFTERLGNVKFFNGATKTVSLMGKISTYGSSDIGLMGLVLAPNFAVSRQIYFWYAPKRKIGQNYTFRLARVPITTDNKLDTLNQKILLEFMGSSTDKWHTGGSMQFDSSGDLWLGMGNNSNDLNPTTCDVMASGKTNADSANSAEWGSSSTASFRGGFLRIHPDESAKGYSIPAGNFGDYWANYWEANNRSDLAAQYRDPKKVFPEIYVKGERSNYSMGAHPTKHWLGWGTVNYASAHDEFNITDHPIFSGFPYFMGNNDPTCTNPPRPTGDALHPKNNSPLNSGVVELPPAMPGVVNFKAGTAEMNTAIGGPWYVYDASNKSPVKFPPHFHNKEISFAFGNSSAWFLNVDSTASPIKLDASNPYTRMDNSVFSNFKLRKPVGARFGTDGALYVDNYDGFYNSALNPAVMRITYEPVAGRSCVLEATSIRKMKPSEFRISLSPVNLIVREPGNHEFFMYDMSGNQVIQPKTGVQGAEYSITKLVVDNHLQKGVYAVRVKTEKGLFVQNISIL